MGFRDNSRGAVDALKEATRREVHEAYRKTFDTLAAPDFDWDFGSMKFVSMEKVCANSLSSKASSQFRSMILEQAKEAGSSETDATFFWNAVYSGLESPLPRVVYADQARVEAARPVIRERRPQVTPQPDASGKFALLPVAAGAAVLGLLTILITPKPLIRVAGFVAGAAVGGAANLAMHKRKAYIPVSMPPASTGDTSKLRSLCEERAGEMSAYFDDWYEKALQTALTIWSRQDEAAE